MAQQTQAPHAKPQESAVLVVAESREDADSAHTGTLSQLKEAFQNKNVGRILMFSFMDGGGHSIWNRQVFPVLIYQVAGDTAVGWMSAYSGFSQMVAAVIAGFVGDRIGRELVLKAGCVAGLIAVTTTMWGVAGLSLGLLYFGQVMWGCYGGVASTGTEALFADSVSTGQRAHIYNLKWMVQSMSSVVGLLLTLILLVYMGNEWKQSAMKKTMYAGLCYHVGAMLLLLTLKQKYAVGDQEAAAEAEATDLVIMVGASSDDEKVCPEGMLSPCASHAHSLHVAGGGGSETSSGDCKCRGEDAERVGEEEARHLDESELPSESADRAPDAHDEAPSEASLSDDEESSAAGTDGEVADSNACGRRKRYRVSTRRTLTPSEYSLALSSPQRQEQPQRQAREATDTATAGDRTSEVLPQSQRPHEEAAPLHVTTVDGQEGQGEGEEEFIGEVAMIRKLNAETEAKRRALHANLAALPAGAWIARLSLRVRFFFNLLLTWECVPYFVCLVDFLVAVGSGMTMRYLSLFFVEAPYNVKPALLITGELVACPLQAIFSYFVQQMGSFHTGRLPATVIVRATGTTLLLFMGITHNVPLWFLFPVYVVRNSLMNSTAGITRSVIMDAVKKENRAKWSAFESFSSFTWAGSAVIGGYIAEAHGHQFTFAITACFHYLSLMALVPAMIGAAPVERQLMHFNRLRRNRMKRQ